MLEFRPHHFLCTLGFVGKGYSEEFVRGFQQIADQLRGPGGDAISIRVVARTDAICAPCPSKRGSHCDSESKIQTLDQAHAEVLELKAGETLTWGEAKKQLGEKMTLEAFHSACAPCAWKLLGVCQAALEKLQNKAGAFAAVTMALAFGFASSQVAQAQSVPVLRLTTVDSVVQKLHPQKKNLKDAKRVKALQQSVKALKDGKYAQARKLAQGLRKDSVFADYGLSLTADSYREEADSDVEAKNFSEGVKAGEQAIPLYIQLQLAYPYSALSKNVADLIGQTELTLGIAHASLKHWQNSITQFERGYQRLALSKGMSQITAEALGKYAQACSKQASQLCPAWMQKFATLYPRNSEEIKAIAQYLPDVMDAAMPARVVGKVTVQYKAPDLDQVAFDAAMASYLNGKYDDSNKAFEKFLEEYPKSAHRFRGRYWMARGLEQTKENDKSKKLLEELMHDTPLGYYGLLASYATAESIDTFIDSKVPPVTETDPSLPPQDVLRLRRAQLLIGQGAADLAKNDLKEIKTRESYPGPFLLYLATLNYEAGYFLGGFQMLSEMILHGYEGVATGHGLKLIFPQAHMDLIEKYSQEYEMDPILMLSLIKQESGFNEDAVSGSGAMGLMQIMPATAVSTDPNVERSELNDVDTNIRVGIKYFSQLMDQFDGNMVFSIAGYNAGPQACKRWLKDGGDKKPMLEFIESIPYRETREYVASIIRNYFWYTHLSDKLKTVPLDYFWQKDSDEEDKAADSTPGN